LGLKLFQRTNYPYHFTASGWVINKERSHSLLIFHKKLRKWIQPGGHADGQINLSIVALTEVKQETGICSLRLINNHIFDFDINPIPAYKNIPAHFHLDVRYLIEADMKEPIIASMETYNVKWFSLNQLAEDVMDEGVIRMTLKL